MSQQTSTSRGCEQCRKAKKRCILEQPACARCLRQSKECSGARKERGMRFRDQTLEVTRKYRVEKADHVLSTATTTSEAEREASNLELVSPMGWFPATSWDHLIPVNASGTNSENTDSLPGHVDGNHAYESAGDEAENTFSFETGREPHNFSLDRSHLRSVPGILVPQPEDVAINYFLRHFAFQNGHWDYVVRYAAQPEQSPSLVFAIKACGMAALNNAHFTPGAGTWSRHMYGKTLKVLNSSLGDRTRSTTDETLITVNMLSFYENLSSDGRRSIQSWRRHIEGATQLLKMRGRTQFQTDLGRALFRETRNQISQSDNFAFIRPADEIMMIAFDLASVRSQIRTNPISDLAAMEMVNEVVARLDQWPITTLFADERWQYHDIQVEDSPHVWNGMVHAYTGFPVPSVWNSHRSLRIIAAEIQQCLSLRLPDSNRTRLLQKSLRAIKQQMTNDICATIPCQLGHADGAYNSPHVLVTAYNSIWPLSLAAKCVMERLEECSSGREPFDGQQTDETWDGLFTVQRQMMWILGRFDFITNSIGLRWASSLLDTLPGRSKGSGVVS